MSIRFSGKLYAGEDSASREVTLNVNDSGYIEIVDVDIPTTHFSETKVSPRLGNGARYLEFADRVTVESLDNDTIDDLNKRWGHKHAGFINRLENSWKALTLSVVGLMAGLYVFVVYGIPALSASITQALPTTLDDRLGSEVLAQLDELVFQPSEIPQQRRDELLSLFHDLTPETGRDFQLAFRSSEIIGANAFALPNAQIIFTDQLIALTEDNDMIGSIMLHEIGHVVERHSMQAAVRQAGLSILIFALTGDVNGAAATLIVLLPSILIQSQYSRELEWDADTYALNEMLKRGVNTDKFADMMERLLDPQEEATGEQTDDDGSMTYFSTHPATQDRIDRFRSAAN